MVLLSIAGASFILCVALMALQYFYRRKKGQQTRFSAIIGKPATQVLFRIDRGRRIGEWCPNVAGCRLCLSTRQRTLSHIMFD